MRFMANSVNGIAGVGQDAYSGFMTKYTTDVAIIGAGPSGLFMVFEAGFLGYKAVVLDAQPQIGGQLAALYPEKPIYDVPGHPAIPAGQLVENLKTQAAPFAPVYLLDEPVLQLEGEAGAFTLTRSGGDSISAKAVVVAGGGGMFTPRKPTQLDNLAEFEKSGHVAYAITNKASLTGQTVVLAGGGDSAVDWAIELAGIATHVHVVHRRADFRAAEASVAEMKRLEAAGKITLHTPTQLHALHGEEGQLSRVDVADLEGKITEIAATRLVCCFGLAPNVGPVEGFDLAMEKGLIPVNRATMETTRKGVFCIGDMADYEGKVALILTGFAEAAVAGKAIQALINPEKKFKVSYSTSKGPSLGVGGGSGA